MGEPVVLDMSLAALQRQDPYISSIVDVASQVALYTFNSKANEWEKTDTEGTLFIYTRLASPRHGFTIRNRLRPENLTEPITKDLDFQVQNPFLLYRNTHLTIRGIWFYNNTDCVRIAQRIKTLSQQEQVSDQSQDGCVSPERGEEKTVDILQLLSKARTEYNKVGSSSEPKQIGGSSVLYGNPNLIKPIPVKPASQDTDTDSTDSRSRSVSLDVLFGFSPQQPPVARAGPRVADSEPGGSGGRGRPPAARSLSYDGVGGGALALVGAGGPPPALQGPSLLASGSAPQQHCTAVHKVIPAAMMPVGQTLQTLSESPESRLVENGDPPALNPHLLHHHHHHLLHHQQQQLHHHHLHHHHLPPPQPLPLCWPRPPPQPAHGAQPLLVESAAGCRHPPLPAGGGGNPLFFDLCRLRQASPGQSAAAYKQGTGVISHHELLQRLQLVQQQQQQTQSPYSPSRAPPAGGQLVQQQQTQSPYSPSRAPPAGGLAARFPAQFSGSTSTATTPQKQLQFHGCTGIYTSTTATTTTTPQKPLQFLDCPGTSSSTTTTPGKDLQFQGVSPHDVSAPVLMSPSVFSQSKSSSGGRPGMSQDTCPVLTRAQDTCPVLTRAQLQTTLLNLLQTDGSFLDSIYEAYLSTTKKY